MTELALAKLLKKLGACYEAVDWTRGKTLAEAWQQCDRADWMLWLCGRMAGQKGWPTRPQIVLVACALAESVLPLFEKRYPTDSRPRKAIEAAQAWAKDPSKPSAAASAYASAAAAYASAAAASAASASAAYASASAAAASAASAAAASAASAYASASADVYDAAYADVYASAYAAAAAYGRTSTAAGEAWQRERLAKLKEFSDEVRKQLTIPADGDR